MKSHILFLAAVLGVCVTATAQVQFASGNYFPAALEFRDLQKVLSEESFDDPARVSKIENGNLILSVGFDKYAQRTYSAEGSRKLSIEVLSLKDSRAAFSLLTLLRGGSIESGPPGDAYTRMPGGIRFYKDRYWVRIQGQGVSDDLLKRIALSVSNRIGTPPVKPPALISHLPRTGYESSSLRYFPGLASFKIYEGAEADSLNLTADAEIAQAQYTVGDHPGVLLLLNFPTGQVAEDYFSALGAGAYREKAGDESYVRRAGPLVAILHGPIDPGSADRFLSALRYSYSIRWIFEKKNESKIIWGVPVRILGTVVRSLFFIAILGVVSIIAGAGFAFLRFGFRERFSKSAADQPRQDGITRLRLR